MPYSYKITGSELFITITAAKTNGIFDINKTLKDLDEIVNNKIYQLFDADKIAGPMHLYLSGANAYNAMESGINISNRLDIETLLYVSTQTQISKAIKTIGVNNNTHRVAIAIFSKNENDQMAVSIAEYLGELDDIALDVTPEKYQTLIKLYNLSISALDSIKGDKKRAITGLIIEKGALISLKR
jgi:tRNA threonylcarbamoyladenosine modification (KEOPS) complex Cgi121 subunit